METKSKFTFNWILENYYEALFEVRNEIVSPRFFLGDNNEWNLYLYFNEREKEMYCYIKRMMFENDERIKLEVLDKDQNIHFSNVIVCESKQRYSSNEIIADYKQLIGKIKEIENTTFTIRLQRESEDLTQVPQMICVALTKFTKNRYSYTWNVTKNVELQQKSLRCEDELFDLILDMRRNIFKIQLQKSYRIQNSVIFKFSLLSTRGIKRETKTVPHTFSKNEDALQFPAFFQKSVLSAEKNSSVLLLCEIFVPSFNCSTDVEFIEQNPQASISQLDSLLHEDIQNMHKNELFSDVKFRINDRTLTAHKCVLSARSPVFHDMFCQDLNTTEMSIIDIQDTDFVIFDLFLKYVYSGSINTTDYELLLKLMTLANKYQVMSLIHECSAILVAIMSLENVCEILLTADTNHNEELKEEALTFIRANASSILKTKLWQQYTKNNINLASEVVACVCSDLNKLNNNLSLTLLKYWRYSYKVMLNFFGYIQQAIQTLNNNSN